MRGEVVVHLITDRVERLAAGAVLTTESGRALTVETSRPHQGNWIVTFDGVLDRTGADALRGVVLRAEPIVDPDEIFVHELIGAAVVDLAGSACGVVEAVQANPAADLLVLDTGALVPATFLVEVRSDGTIVIDPPDGLLDVNG